ncbi:MAG TPA: ATP-binding cassette domain-containing protein [Verrucomicrobiae bacterium]|jgi:ABC-type transporter Mla maintaining outer membrane lipid asymmetry ATPase subunit MlaF
MSDEAFNSQTIELRDVTAVSLRDATMAVAEAVDWSVSPGEFWVIGGQQRSGKSDLLMLAAGLIPPAQGTCRVFGCNTESLGEAQLAEWLRTGFVFQGGQLFNRLTIAENIALPLRYQKDLTTTESTRAVEVLLEMFELVPFADLTPLNVAANWRSRAALARALILKPELLLLDNPLYGLGARHSQWMLRFLDQLWHGHEYLGGRPITLVVATDDFRPWQHAQRKFALLHEKKFTALGFWTEIKTADQLVVRELMAETEEIQN